MNDHSEEIEVLGEGRLFIRWGVIPLVGHLTTVGCDSIRLIGRVA